MSTSSASTPKAAWRVGDFGPLGWLETILKLGGVGVGIAALAVALGHDASAPAGTRLAAVVVLGLLCLALLAAIADRLADREIIGMIFIPLMNAGHLAMLAALIVSDDVHGHLAAFAALMLAGDVVKLVFLRVTGFRVRDVSPAVVYSLVSTFVVGYLALIALAVAAL
ncbi:MAG: hypothetical protein RIB67_06395 [Miltoncostaeaceae bacterium]